VNGSGLLESLARLLEQNGIDLAAWGLAWARVAPLLAVVPAFGLRALSASVRAAAADNAQATDKAAVQALEKELRDRFGPLPAALQLLLQVAEIKILASERDITSLEVKEDRLMLMRNADYIMVGSKFPRLTKTEAGARLKPERPRLPRFRPPR